MTLPHDRLDPEWAENGSISESITDAKIETGFVGGTNPDRPTVEMFNFLLNRIDKKINEVLEGGFKTLNPSGSMINHIQRLYPSGPCGIDLSIADNQLGDSAESYWSDLNIYVVNGKKHLIALNADSETIDDFDLETKEVVQRDLSGTLSTPNGTWRLCSACTDNTFVYVLWNDNSPSVADRYCLHSYRLSDWLVNPNWTATGVLLSHVGAINDGPEGKIIICATGKLALVKSWRALNLTQQISIRNTFDGSELLSTKGDCTRVHADGRLKPILVSDGAYVYFVATDPVLDDQICSASITTGAGCGGSSWPLTRADVVNLYSAGGIIYANISDDNTVYGMCSADATLGSITDDSSAINSIQSLVYDGCCIWGLAQHTPSPDAIFVKLPEMEMLKGNPGDLVLTYPFQSYYLGTTDIGIVWNPIVFDGQDFYFLENNGSGQGGIFKFPKPLLR